MNRFKAITLTFALLSLLVIAIAVTIGTLVAPNQATPLRKVLPKPASKTEIDGKGKSVAAWIWEYPTKIVGEIGPLLEFAESEKINTIYLYVDEYVDIYEMTDEAEKTRKMAKYLEALQTILSEAKKRNLSVHAMMGNTNYSYDSHSYIPPLVIDHVYDFNDKNQELSFDGIQFDVEFYDNDQFFRSTNEYTDSFLQLVTDSVTQVGKLNGKYNQQLKLGIVIPFWFDKPNDYFGDPIYPDILQSLSSLEGSYLVIMAYRNKLEAVMEISKEELVAAQTAGVEIVVAQELSKNTEETITHFGKSRDQIKQFLNQLLQAGSEYSSFAGIGLHDLDAYKNTL